MSAVNTEGKKYPSIGSFYNADIRNNGTPRRVTEAMKRMGMGVCGFKRYTRPMEENEISKHDLHLFLDDGRDDIEWLPPKPNACWLVDTHLGFEQRLEWARKFDTVFVAQKEAVSLLEAEGIEKVFWLPLACSPYLDPDYKSLQKHFGREKDLTRIYDCAFVGYLNRGVEKDKESHDRVLFLDHVYKKFPNSWLAFNLFFEEAAVRYVRARVGLNISIKHDLNMRFFEALSYGVCQVCNRDMEGWSELGFVEGEDFLGFETLDEACEKIQWALDNPSEREKIAESGMAKVRASHTYADRIRKLLSLAL